MFRFPVLSKPDENNPPSFHRPSLSRSPSAPGTLSCRTAHEQWNLTAPHGKLWVQLFPVSSALRVCGLPDAAQLVRLHRSAAGELQEPLNVVEDCQLEVGEGKLHLSCRAQPRHLSAHAHTHTHHVTEFLWKKVSKVTYLKSDFLTLSVSARWGDGAHSTSSRTSDRGAPEPEERNELLFFRFSRWRTPSSSRMK